MTKKDDWVFTGLKVAAWIIYIGLCIEAGSLLVSMIVSVYKPELADHLYLKLNLAAVYQQSKRAFFSMSSFILAVAFLKCYLFHQVTVLMQKLHLTNPFTEKVARQIASISYTTFSTGIVSYIGRQSVKNFSHLGFSTGMLSKYWADSEAFILMAAVVYVIAKVFERGVDIQTENDLTV